MENQREKHNGGHRVQPEKKKSRLTAFQKVLVVIAVILAITLVGVVACQSLFVQPELDGNKRPSDTEQEKIDWGEGSKPRAEGKRKSEDFYTVLVLGRDTGGGGNTDTMLLASYDVTNQKAAVMSIPRDTMVNVPWDVKKINSVYNFYGGGDKGIKALYKEIAQLVGFEPDYQVILEWDAVGAIVDAIGGVWFDVPYRMDYQDPYQDLRIDQEPGYRLLSGDDAMQVIRWRKNSSWSPHGYHNGIGDAGRMKLQQDFLKALLAQLMKPENVLNIGKIAQVVQDNIETDLSFQNILWFAKQAVSGGLSPDTVEFMTMPYKDASAYSRSYSKPDKPFKLSYVVPKATELLDVVNNHLSPYVELFTLRDLDIMSVNPDGTISSTTGRVEDTPATMPPPKPVPKPEEGEEGENPDDPENPDDVIIIDPDQPVDPETSTNPDGEKPETPDQPEKPEKDDPETKPEPNPEPKPEVKPEPKPEPQPEPPAPVEPPVDDSGFIIIDPSV